MLTDPLLWVVATITTVIAHLVDVRATRGIGLR